MNKRNVIFILVLLFVVILSAYTFFTKDIKVSIDNNGEIHKEYCFFITEQIRLNNIHMKHQENSLIVTGEMQNNLPIPAKNVYLFLHVYYYDHSILKESRVFIPNIHETLNVNERKKLNETLSLYPLNKNILITKVEISGLYAMSSKDYENYYKKYKR